MPGASWLVAAIHGGNIETGNTPIAPAVSHSADLSYYSFCSAWAIIGGVYEEGVQFLGDCLSGVIDIRNQTPSGRNYPGFRQENICNQGMAGGGIQLELFGDLRRELLSSVHFLGGFSRCIGTALQFLAMNQNPEKNTGTLKKKSGNAGG